MPPAVVNAIVPGREPNDCAVCVLAMFLGVSYETVLREVALVDRRYQGREGLSLHQIGRIAKQLGTPLRRRRRVDLHSVYAILALTDHVVVLRNGLVIDPVPGGAAIWDVDDYLAHYREVKFECVLVPKPTDADPGTDLAIDANDT